METQKVCKAFSVNHLLESGLRFSYDCRVTDAALWAAVGKELSRRRKAQGFQSREALREARRISPVPNTMKVIEKGHAASVEAVTNYCQALGTTTSDVIRTVLDAADGLGPTLTDAEWEILQAYRDIPDSTLKQHWEKIGLELAAEARAKAAGGSG